MGPKPFNVKDVTLGLVTTDPPTALPPGALRVADNVAVTDGVLRSAHGFTRVTNTLFGDHSYILDGYDQHFYGKVEAQDTTLQLQTAANTEFTVEVVFRLDGMPVDVVSDASFPTAMSMLVFKGPEADLYRSPGTKAPADINWYLAVFTECDGGNSGKLYCRFVTNWDSSGVETVDNLNSEVEIGKWYHAVMTCDGDQIHTYVHEVGTSLGTVADGNTGHSGERIVRNTRDLYIGACPVTKAGTATVISSSSQVSVDADTQTYTLNSGTWTKTPAVGSQVLVAGASNSSNNGVKRVTESTTTTFKLEADTSDLTDESAGAGTVTITEYHGEDRNVQFGFRGVIQEVRVWTDVRSSTELTDYDDVQFTASEVTSETNLVYYQRLTGAGTDTYYFASAAGTAGTGSGQSPRVTVMPRDVTWRGTGHVLGNPASGDYTHDLDGVAQGLSIQNAHRYRKSTVNDDGELEWPDYWGFSAKVTPRTLADRMTVFHYAPTLDDEWTIHRLGETTASSTFTSLTADASANVLLEIIDTGSSTYEFRAVVWHRTGGGTVYATSEESSIGGISAGTEYTVTIGVDAVSRKVHLYVNANSNTSSDWQRTVISGSSAVAVSASAKTYTLGSGTWTTTPAAGDRIFWSGFVDDTNNGWKTVTAATSTVITVVEALDDAPYTVLGSSTSVTVDSGAHTFTIGAGNWDITPAVGDTVTFTGFSQSVNNTSKTVTAATSTVITFDGAVSPGITETANVTAVGNVVSSVTCVLESKVYSTPKGDYQGTQKYAAALGRSLLRSRQLNALPGDPNGIEVEYDKGRSFDGQLRQVVIAVPQNEWSLESLHNLNYTQAITLGSVAKVGIGVVSAWLFTEGRGESVEDVATGNNLEFREDPDHVWGYSGITTNDKSVVKGLFDHRYTTASGEVKYMVAIAGGSAYAVDESDGTSSLLADGFRNDDGNIVSTMKYKDSQILCAGRGARGNYHLWRDQLWRLDIEPPTGTIPFGLTDQKNKEASLQAGVYKGLFTFYSAYTGKESPIGDVFQWEVKKNRANLALGDVAEINQTYPSTGLSINKEPYDIEADDGNGTDERTGFKAAAWIGVSGTDKIVSSDPDWWESDPLYSTILSGTDTLTTERESKLKRVLWDHWDQSDTSHNKNSFIGDRNEMTDDEFAQTVEDGIGRVFVEVDPLGFVEVKGRFVGRNAYLRIRDLSNAADPDMISAASGEIGFPGVTGSPLTALYRGSGDVGHGLKLPVSNDPQVTHLRFYRTLANDSTFRLAEQVPNGTTGFIHYTPDTSLVGQVLDITVGPPPAVEYVSDFGGRAIYIKDPDFPDVVYFSEVDQPWNVPAENVVKMADGDSIALTGVGRTEGALMLFKDDTTFVLRPPTSPFLPFSIETRQRDVGCVAPFSVTNIHDRIYFCGEKGMYSYDTASLQYLSSGIEPTWEGDVSVTNRDKIVAVHDRKNDAWMIAYPTGNTSVNGSVVNDRMLVLDYTVGRSGEHVMGWTRRTNLSASLFAIIPDANDIDRIYFADPLGYIYEWDNGENSYGPGTLTDTSVTVSAGGTTSVTVTQATLARVPDGYKGFWVTLVRAADGSRESMYVTDDDLASPSVLTVSNWSGADPVSGDTLLVGSVEANAIFGEISPYGPSVVSHVIDTFLRLTKFSSDTSNLVRWEWQGLGGVGNSHNEQDPSFSSVLTEQGAYLSNTKVDVRLATGCRGRRIAFRILSLGPDQPFILREFTFTCEPAGDGEYSTLTV